MIPAPRSVTVLGSTGSVGTQTVELLAARPDRYHVRALVADTEQRAYGAQDRATIECSDTHTRVDPTTGHPLEVNIVTLNMPTPA